MKTFKLPSRRKVADALRNAPLTVCCVTLSVSLEAFAAFGILEQSHGLVGVFEAALCLSCGMLALVISGNATDMKRDPRPMIRNSAFGARLLSLMLLIPSTYYVGLSFAYQKQMADYRTFHGSAEEAAYKAMLDGRGEYVDSQVRLEAAAQLSRGTKPERASFDPLATAWAGLILTLNALAIGMGRRPKPETEAEAKRRIALARAAKAKATKAKNRQQGFKPRLVA